MGARSTLAHRPLPRGESERRLLRPLFFMKLEEKQKTFAPEAMRKKRIRLADGRYEIFYTFGPEDVAEDRGVLPQTESEEEAEGV